MAGAVLQMEINSIQEPKPIFLGMRSPFSLRVLERLVQEGVKPVALWIPTSSRNGPAIRLLSPETVRSELPILNAHMSPDITHVAWQHGVPVYEVSDLSSLQAHRQLACLEATVGIVACFPHKVPSAVLAQPRYGFMNLHPSLLPNFRGPYPLFWTFRCGIRRSGITLHVMDSNLDTGEIVLQEPIELPDGIGGTEADLLFADEGAKLILQAIASLASGNVAHRPQEKGGSYYGRPTTKDFIVPTSWSARRAFNFMRGTEEWNQPYVIEGEAFRLATRSALLFDPEATLEAPLIHREDETWVSFEPGYVVVSNR